MLQGIFIIYPIYSFSKLIKRIRKDEAVLTLTAGSITINDFRSQKTIQWKDVRDVSIQTDDSIDYLLLQTIYGEEKIGVNWLNKKPAQIKRLV